MSGFTSTNSRLGAPSRDTPWPHVMPRACKRSPWRAKDLPSARTRSVMRVTARSRARLPYEPSAISRQYEPAWPRCAPLGARLAGLSGKSQCTRVMLSYERARNKSGEVSRFPVLFARSAPFARMGQTRTLAAVHATASELHRVTKQTLVAINACCCQTRVNVDTTGGDPNVGGSCCPSISVGGRGRRVPLRCEQPGGA
jgi:hypothetical protein